MELSEIWGWKFVRKVSGQNGALSNRSRRVPSMNVPKFSVFGIAIFYTGLTNRQGDQICPIGDCLPLAKVADFLGHFIKLFSLRFNFDKKWVGLHFGRIFHKLFWSPWKQYVSKWTLCSGGDWEKRIIFVRQRTTAFLVCILNLSDARLCKRKGSVTRRKDSPP
jgi:hypothetical protein